MHACVLLSRTKYPGWYLHGGSPARAVSVICSFMLGRDRIPQKPYGYFDSMDLDRTSNHHAALTRNLPLGPLSDSFRYARHDPMRLPDIHLIDRSMENSASKHHDVEYIGREGRPPVVVRWESRKRGAPLSEEQRLHAERLMKESRTTQEQRRTDYSEGRRREAAYMAAQEDGYSSGFEWTGTSDTSLELDLSRDLSREPFQDHGSPYAEDYEVAAPDGYRTEVHEPVAVPMSRSGHGQSSLKSPVPLNKRHKCPYCSMDFTRHHNLKSHLLTHSQEKPYECQTCNKRFRRLRALKLHTKFHTEGTERQAVPSTTLSHRLRSELVCQTVSRDDTSSEDAKISAFVKIAMEPHVRKARMGGLSRLDTSSFLLTRKPSSTPSEDVEYDSYPSPTYDESAVGCISPDSPYSRYSPSSSPPEEPHVRKARMGGLSRLDTTSFLPTSPTPSEDVRNSPPHQTSSPEYTSDSLDFR